MNKLLLILVLGGLSNSVYAQLYDKVGLSGQSVFTSTDTYALNHSDNIRVEYQMASSPLITRDSLGANFILNNITISDSSGENLLFYSNGVTVRDRYNQIMQNGDSLAFNWWLANNQMEAGIIGYSFSYCSANG